MTEPRAITLTVNGRRCQLRVEPRRLLVHCLRLDLGLAGTLQDAHRAALIGETTFGTSTGLSSLPFSDGSVLLLATEEWLRFSRRMTWHHGITPDLTVALPAGAAPLLPKREQSLTPEQLRASQDAQLK